MWIINRPNSSLSHANLPTKEERKIDSKCEAYLNGLIASIDIKALERFTGKKYDKYNNYNNEGYFKYIFNSRIKREVRAFGATDDAINSAYDGVIKALGGGQTPLTVENARYPIWLFQVTLSGILLKV